MMLFSSVSIIAASTFIAGVNTQAIDPDTVPEGTRSTWCTTQKSSCPLLCTQIGGTTRPESNDCDPDTLVYSCVCSNGLQPNASEYSQTIPYFECTETANQCADNCPNGDNNCVTQCRTATPCGAQDPKRVNVTSSSSSTVSATGSGATASASESNDYSGFGGPDSADNPASASDSAARSLTMNGVFVGRGEKLGMLAISAGFLAGFFLIL